jgi:hypothetical protein
LLKFLVDAQAARTFVSQLRALGYDVAWVAEMPELRSADDATVLTAARAEGRVLLSFDLFRGQTRRRVYEELVTNGGKIVTIAGGPEQPSSRSVGKLLYHSERIESLLGASDGRIHIGDLRPDSLKWQSRDEIAQALHPSP